MCRPSSPRDSGGCAEWLGCAETMVSVQMSVFECSVSNWFQLRHELLEEINLQEDSLRLYNLGESSVNRVEHHGQRPSTDFDQALII